MSFLGASGTSGSAGHASPLVPGTSVSVSRVDNVSNGSTPNFIVSSTSQAQVGQKKNIYEGYNLYKASDNTLVRSATSAGTTNYSTIAAGTSYYAKPYIVDTVTNRSAEGTASSSIIAMTRPATVSTVTGSSGIGYVYFSWTAADNGGDVNGFYYRVELFIGGVLNTTTSVTTNNFTFNTTSTSSTYTVRVTSGNSYSLAAAASSTSNGVSPSAAPPYFPPPPPPPYFAPPPYFPPYFGGGCIEANTPIMVWVDGNTLYKKAEEIKIGDKLVSYSFDELPESEVEYSLETWSQDSLTARSVESAEVVSVQELITKSTMYLNNDINTRMSLDHSVFVKKNGTYLVIASGLIEVGDIIIKLDPETLELNEVIVDSIDYIEEESKIYKIDCNPYDVFFAGDVLTHNFKKFY